MLWRRIKLPLQYGNYAQLRQYLMIGDMIAWTGGGVFGTAIKAFTGEPTHVGAVRRIEEAGRGRVMLVEAIEGKGVVQTYLSERIAEAKGTVDIYFRDRRIPFSESKAAEYLDGIVGMDYSMAGAVFQGGLGGAIPVIGRFFGKDVFRDALFCSRVLDQMARAAGVPEEYLFNDQTPAPNQVARWKMWANRYRVWPEVAVPIEGANRVAV
ncbi:MAG: hypothetical protein VKL39_01865 [Leptolyngbyaceae bacterium]|nr:hypothetical protein [Leptolyngbyaceae bacterium]